MERVPKSECDSCAGRNPIRKWCQECQDDLLRELAVEGELIMGTDREGRRHIDKIPDDPSMN